MTAVVVLCIHSGFSETDAAIFFPLPGKRAECKQGWILVTMAIAKVREPVNCQARWTMTVPIVKA
jgi:hypothetical protein